MKTTPRNQSRRKLSHNWSFLLAMSLIVLFAGLAFPASAAKVIGINFAGSSTAGNMQPGDAAGAPGVRSTNWNNINVVNATAPVTLGQGSAIDNSGNLQSDFSASLFPNTFNPGGGASATATNENKLYGFAMDTQPGATENALLLSGIPYTNYYIFVYRNSTEGSLAAPRGGYFSVRDVSSNFTYITNLDLTVTNSVNIVTNFVSTVWMSSTNFANPGTSGSGYARSFTTNQPSLMSQIDNANYGILPGDPNSTNVSYSTNIDLATATTNVVATTNVGVWLYFTPVGAGLRGVTGGDSVQRFKGAGVQIVSLPTANLTNIVLASPLPDLFDGSTAVMPLNPVGQYDDGDTFPLWLLPNTTYGSDNTNVVTVDGGGNVHPAHGGSANITITSGTFNTTVPVTVLTPTAIRLSMSSPTNLFVGNGVSDKGQAQLFADFPGAETNSAVSNINVTKFNFVVFSGSPAELVNVSTNGVVTAVGAGGSSLFSLHAVYDTLAMDANAVGHTQLFPAPGSVSSFGINLWDGASLDAANFKDLAGSPGNRQAYWNNLNFTLPSATSPSNAVVNPVDYHGNVLNGTTFVMTGGGFSFVNQVSLTTNENRIIGTALDEGRNGNGTSTLAAERVIVVTNVPYSVYDAYFYFCNQPANPARIAHVTSMETLETRWRQSPATLPGSLDNAVPNPTNGAGYLQAIPIISGGSIPNGVLPGSLANIPAGNYVKFTGLTNPIAQFRWGPDDKDSASDADSTMRTRLSAVQIVKNLGVLTPTNLYLDTFSSNIVSILLPGDPTPEPISAFADFTDGTLGGNVTSLATFTSTDPNVFNVDTNGLLTAGTVSGNANLIVSFKTLSITQAVTTLAPMSVTIKASPDTAYINGQAQPGALRMLATFPGMTNVDITGFTNNTVMFYDASSASANVAVVFGPPWFINPVAEGVADLAGSYLGVGYTNAAGFSVRTNSQPGDTFGVLDTRYLKHRYSFDESPGSSVIVDSVGGANGVVVPGLAGSFPLVFDGSRVNFPSNNVYSTTPYIALPSGLISERGDLTIDMWCGMNEAKDWARFFDAGSSGKGTDEHADGNGITWLEFSGKPGGNANPILQVQFTNITAVSVYGTGPFPIGTEQHVTLVFSPNQGVSKMYINGVLVATGSAPAPLNWINDANIWLGVSQFQDPVLDGWIHELRIYEGAFTDEEVAASDTAGPDVGLSIASPVISVSRAGTNAVLSWPLSAADFILKSNTVINGTWYPVGSPLMTNGGSVQTAVPLSGTNAFFLLQKP